MIFPLMKKRNEKDFTIEDIYLMKDRPRSFEVDKSKADDIAATVNHSFFVNSSEYGEYNDTFCMVS